LIFATINARHPTAAINEERIRESGISSLFRISKTTPGKTDRTNIFYILSVTSIHLSNTGLCSF
jgi:hypothetical protein